MWNTFEAPAKEELMMCVYGAALQSGITTGDGVFPECRLHSGKGQLHSGKLSPSATLGEEDPGKSSTGKPTSPRVKESRTRGSIHREAC
jgi:hypothetical protein